jgi:hypothetical protein
MKMSPLTTVVQCPHYEKGQYRHELEGVKELPSREDSNRWEGYLERSKQRDRHLLPSCKTPEGGLLSERARGLVHGMFHS